MPILDTTFLDYMTRKHFEPALKNQIYDRRVLWNKLNEGGRIKTLVGSALQWNVVNTKHQAIGLLSGYETMANQQVNPVTQATLNPAFYYATVGISMEEEIKNSGSMEKLLDMVSTQFDNARISLETQMNTDAYGTGATISGKYPITGLGAICDQYGGTITTYAGISRASATSFWNSYVDSTAYTYSNSIDTTSNQYLPKVMRTAYATATHDLSPNLILTTKNVYNMYMDIVAEKVRIDNKMADLGFGGAEFMGGAAKLAFDDYATPNHMWFLTLDDFALWVYAGMNFNTDGWKVPTDQAAKLTHIFWMGQLQCTAPREQAVITAVATS